MFPQCPQPPDWAIDWASLDSLPWLQDMKGCPQNPDRHAEGDVWNHVHLVTEAMVTLPTWRELPEDDRRTLFLSALLHDVAKPACTRQEPDGRVSARGHSWRGAVIARRLLWYAGVSFAMREAVCAIVRHHLVPFFLIDSVNPRRLAIEVSQTARCELLAIMAEADVRGRICPDPPRLFEQIARFRQEALDAGCWATPFEFHSPEDRFEYFHEGVGQRPADGNASEVVLMCGLPAAGKDHWRERHVIDWPSINLDELRQRMGVPPADPQGIVLNRAREIALDHLRQGRNFVWNACNLSRNIRADSVRLFHAHHARVRLQYVEAPSSRLFQQNQQRKHRLPERVIERMMDRWEVPDVTEAHLVSHEVME